MSKWYEQTDVDSNIIVSSRIRLARNLSKYPFSIKMKDENADEMITDVKNSLNEIDTSLGQNFNFVDLNNVLQNEKLIYMEKHIISPELFKKKQPCGIIYNNDETINIMLNEEDHIRIQTIFSGENIKQAWEEASKADDFLEENIRFAFDENYGYLTSCPTNVGTGLRASYMMHLPALEFTKQIKNVYQAVSKFGITIRGTYGEGSDAAGSLYQISNQVTLGKTEEEIIDNLKSVAEAICENEERIRDIILRTPEFEDKVYRAYGILIKARKISAEEALEYLSYIREGYILNFLEEKKPKLSIYNIMLNIHNGSLQGIYGKQIPQDKIDYFRASYIREQFI